MAYDRRYLEDMVKRMENVVKGACLMTDTTLERIKEEHRASVMEP